MSSGNRIRYVSLSDMHFGEEDSLFTALETERYECDPSKASPTTVAIVAALREIIGATGGGKPTLVLNGDILELAFASYSRSLASFKRFLELVIAPGEELFDRILYVPGNHDHHVWEIARETQFVNNVLDEGCVEDLPRPHHATPLHASAAVPSYLLNQLIKQVRKDAPTGAPTYSLDVLYPNFAVVDPRASTGVLFHHGHYVEPAYHFLSRLRRALSPGSEPPVTVDDLEAENFGWIDFVWSVLGRSGEAGEHAEVLYKKLQYDENQQAFVDELAARVATSVDIPGVPGDWLEEKVLRLIFGRLAKRLLGERHSSEESSNDDVLRGLEQYIHRFCLRQFYDEVGSVPDTLRVVIGHTHKPFATQLEVDGRNVDVFNSGGWVVDGAKPSADHGGAVVLVSETLDVAAVSLFGGDAASFEPGLIGVSSGPSGAAFGEALRGAMGAASGCIGACSEAVAHGAEHRRRHMERLYMARGGDG